MAVESAEIAAVGIVAKSFVNRLDHWQAGDVLVPKQLLSRPDYEPVTRVRLASHLRQIGVTEGGVLMVHVRLSAFGWVVGGWIRSCTPSVTPLERRAR